MEYAVRYYSRSGNTKQVAESLARAYGVEAVSVDAADAALKGPVDVLFIGGALYAYGIDSHLKEYIKTLRKDDVKEAVIFSTSWFSRHAIDLIKTGLEEQGIKVSDKTLYFRGKPSEKQKDEARAFAKQFM